MWALGLVFKTSGSGAEGAGFESWPGHGVMSLGKTFTTHVFPTGLPSVSYNDWLWIGKERYRPQPLCRNTLNMYEVLIDSPRPDEVSIT